MLFFGPIALLALAIPELWQKQSKGERYDLVLIRTGPAADPLIFADAVLRSPSYRIAGLVTVLDAAMNLGWTPTVSTTGIAIVLQLGHIKELWVLASLCCFCLTAPAQGCSFRIRSPQQLGSSLWQLTCCWCVPRPAAAKSVGRSRALGHCFFRHVQEDDALDDARHLLQAKDPIPPRAESKADLFAW